MMIKRDRVSKGMRFSTRSRGGDSGFLKKGSFAEKEGGSQTGPVRQEKVKEGGIRIISKTSQ